MRHSIRKRIPFGRSSVYTLVLLALSGCPKAMDLADPLDGNDAGDLRSSSSSVDGQADLSGGDLRGIEGAKGDCQSDAECPSGRCVELSKGGFKVCALPPKEATRCMSPMDQCCSSGDCEGGKCYEAPLIQICTGVMPVLHNVCGADRCQSDADCPNASKEVCVPAGALGFKIRGCMQAACKTQSDCSARPGGICAPVTSPCCAATLGLYCVYPNGGCRRNSDCPRGSYCDVMGQESKCIVGVPRCPAKE